MEWAKTSVAARLHYSLIFFSYFSFFIIIREMNLANFCFKSDSFESHQSIWHNLYKGYTMCTSAAARHADGDCATSIQSRQSRGCDSWRNHVILSGATSHTRYFSVTSTQNRASIPFSLSSSASLHLVVTPLVICEFSPLFGARDAINWLHELISQSCWVRTSSVPSHFVVFWFFRLNELMW
jgi:hypothetical protein